MAKPQKPKDLSEILWGISGKDLVLGRPPLLHRPKTTTYNPVPSKTLPDGSSTQPQFLQNNPANNVPYQPAQATVAGNCCKHNIISRIISFSTAPEQSITVAFDAVSVKVWSPYVTIGVFAHMGATGDLGSDNLPINGNWLGTCYAGKETTILVPNVGIRTITFVGLGSKNNANAFRKSLGANHLYPLNDLNGQIMQDIIGTGGGSYSPFELLNAQPPIANDQDACVFLNQVIGVDFNAYAQTDVNEINAGGDFSFQIVYSPNYDPTTGGNGPNPVILLGSGDTSHGWQLTADIFPGAVSRLNLILNSAAGANILHQDNGTFVKGVLDIVCTVSIATKTYAIYVNGQLTKAAAYPNVYAPSNNPITVGNIAVGAAGRGSWYNATGHYQSLTTFPRVLTQFEIGNLHNQLLQPPVSSAKSIINITDATLDSGTSSILS